MQRLQSHFRAEEVRRREKREEEDADADYQSALMEPAHVFSLSQTRIGRKRKREKGQGGLSDEDDPWPALAIKRRREIEEKEKEKGKGGLVGLHDVVLAPPKFAVKGLGKGKGYMYKRGGVRIAGEVD